MKFLNLLTLASAAAVAGAAPLMLTKRAIFVPTSYNDISISGGAAGGAAQAAMAKLGGLPNDLSEVSQEDIDFLDNVNTICNDAEKGAFNTAIEAANGDEADALQVREPLIIITEWPRRSKCRLPDVITNQEACSAARFRIRS